SFDKDMDHSFDRDMDHSFDKDMDHSFDKDMDHSFDRDAGTHLDLDVDPAVLEPSSILFSDKGQKSPLLMRVSSYLMFSGVLGIIFYFLASVNLILLLCLAFIPPLLFNRVIGVLWRKLTVSETYIIPSEVPLVGFKVTVVTPVDIDGGIVKIKSNSPLGYQKIPVLPLYPDKKFLPGEEIFICSQSTGGKRFYLVDDNPKEIKEHTRYYI
ncbi:MAG: hypothetical protein ACTSU9_05675, partial [Promethearchaeota archaeon]